MFMEIRQMILTGIGIFVSGTIVLMILRFILTMLQITVGIVWNLGMLAVFFCAIGYVGTAVSKHLSGK